MSYILDALKRADAERGNRQATDAPGSAFPPAQHQPPRKARIWYGFAAGLLAILGVTAFFSLSKETVETAAAEPKPALPTPAATVATAAPPASLEVPTSLAPPTPAEPPQNLPRPRVLVPQQTVNVVAIAPNAAPQTVDVLAAGPSTPPTFTTSPPEAPPAQPPAPEAITETVPTAPVNPPNSNSTAPQVEGSPRSILKRVPLPPGPSTNSARPPPPKVAVAGRPALPAATAQPPAATSISHAGHPEIVITGTSYSTNAAHRMLIVNGKVLKEGQEMSPGLTLESIGQRTAVFNQGGSRFNVNY